MMIHGMPTGRPFQNGDNLNAWLRSVSSESLSARNQVSNREAPFIRGGAPSAHGLGRVSHAGQRSATSREKREAKP